MIHPKKLLCALILTACMMSHAGHAADVETLLETSTTVLDQPIVYPTQGTPKITAVIVTLQPGEESGTHQHPIPLFGYILSGELTVVYEDNRTIHLKEGDPVIEAYDVWHDGHNSGTVPTRILAVFMGDTAQPNTMPKKAPE